MLIHQTPGMIVPEDRLRNSYNKCFLQVATRSKPSASVTLSVANFMGSSRVDMLFIDILTPCVFSGEADETNYCDVGRTRGGAKAHLCASSRKRLIPTGLESYHVATAADCCDIITSSIFAHGANVRL
jgi:hypothetical protein